MRQEAKRDAMSVIVNFPLHRVSPAPASPGAGAEIVIFPGVRIERQDIASAPRKSSNRPRRNAASAAKEIENF